MRAVRVSLRCRKTGQRPPFLLTEETEKALDIGLSLDVKFDGRHRDVAQQRRELCSG